MPNKTNIDKREILPAKNDEYISMQVQKAYLKEIGWDRKVKSFASEVLDALKEQDPLSKVKSLIEQGRDVNEKNPVGGGALLFVALKDIPERSDLLELLLKHGADILGEGEQFVTSHNLTSKSLKAECMITKPIHHIPLKWLKEAVIKIDSIEIASKEDLNLVSELWKGLEYLVDQKELFENDEISDEVHHIFFKLEKILDQRGLLAPEEPNKAISDFYSSSDSYSSSEEEGCFELSRDELGSYVPIDLSNEI
ncbi:MAG: hypothetical protein K0Q51_26 [Rickettsiaceae bacterium]|nr:hypothetical protein [Rickettsiaceae bacterium]